MSLPFYPPCLSYSEYDFPLKISCDGVLDASFRVIGGTRESYEGQVSIASLISQLESLNDSERALVLEFRCENSAVTDLLFRKIAAILLSGLFPSLQIVRLNGNEIGEEPICGVASVFILGSDISEYCTTASISSILISLLTAGYTIDLRLNPIVDAFSPFFALCPPELLGRFIWLPHLATAVPCTVRCKSTVAALRSSVWANRIAGFDAILDSHLSYLHSGLSRRFVPPLRVYVLFSAAVQQWSPSGSVGILEDGRCVEITGGFGQLTSFSWYAVESAEILRSV